MKGKFRVNGRLINYLSDLGELRSVKHPEFICEYCNGFIEVSKSDSEHYLFMHDELEDGLFARLKDLGFIVESKSVEEIEIEVLEKYKSALFVIGFSNYHIYFNNETSKYDYDWNTQWRKVGVKYMSKEDCVSAVNELNIRFVYNKKESV